ncbi:MAG: hypothetical protein IJW21_03220 [Clostridia bacterium]|nr:hypothetical protein [Clostridia bacterium]
MKKNYIKKLCALALAGVLTLTACDSGKASTQGTSAAHTTSASSQVTTSAATEQNKKPDYTELKCESPKNYTYINLLCGESVKAINLALPDGWKLYKEDGETFSITKYGKEIGKLYRGTESVLDEGKTEVYTDTKVNLGIETVYSVNRYGEDEYTYRRKIIFNYTDGEEKRSVTLDVKYTEIDDAGVRSLRSVPHMWEVVTEPKFGTVSFPEENPSRKIIILGNSFVSTSRIGDMIASVCGGEDMTKVMSVSLPNVSIKDYAVNEYWLSRIESGEYGILFMCGLFSNDDVKGLEVIYEACKKGGTRLVLFPAHNENSACIERAQAKYPELVTVDWRNEITKLIYSGINKWQFCMNDGPEHSTPLAGYVGASMIYRAIYGKMPTRTVSYSSCGISQDVVEQILGDYIETGIIYGASKSTIFIFEE